ncbi:hypothetical protein [Liquorilactobacillus mali]|uniref:Helix-turn-helix domain-containing protein n=1 Tax=Liquorilactobacillus mali KCTC 3596 = DSM 20444 TaxID=1046596 RepID=J0USY0_9LACO|nr:hypothetical protein [Liquorilactobacillus mali]EJF00204.1 prophage Lp3 protein 4 [Liquorilactobacillus mali KCTC 3596 = DSM 20444]KRN08319.1 hypothetical protein FD00_GL002305 [Liquorilactobacillus mali KCTC 3596 = DSM 20444]QFQ74216.1 helix-turn-helix domain-containing protein [Liquorilactobacillus mali]
MKNELPRFMNYGQALKFFNIGSYNTLYKFIEMGLPVVKVGTLKRIDQQVAEEWFEKQTIK